MGSISFSEEQEAMVKEAWELMKPNVQELGLKMFSLVGQMLPEAAGMFYFLKDPNQIPQNNPQLRSHVVKVFTMTCESAAQLRQNGKVVPVGSTLKRMGSIHLKKGVQESHFEVIKVAFLKVVKEAVGEKWSEEMGAAWAEAYDQLAAAFIAEMKIQSAN
ncbi:non-symbiotic hemoglobin 2-like [Nymphaea colorata]|nr:non-symbiotic hemoglobin 2-like [Nymphaea colorata]